MSHFGNHFAHSYHRIFRRRRRRPVAPPPTFTSKELAGLYGYPVPLGPLPAVAILELGGGYQQNDMKAFCSSVGLPVPQISSVNIQGGSNAPTGNPNGPDGEVGLDMQCIVGATYGLAPLVMVWCGNLSSSFAAGIQWVADNAAAQNIAALSISWGQYEQAWSPTDLAAMDAALQSCASAGVSVFAASGDSGGDDEGARGVIDVDYPAASPWCFGVGGTTAAINGSMLTETAWSGSGGGFSVNYAKPTWQNGNSGTMRAVPDGSAIADPSTGYNVWIDGRQETIGGTSAAAPMWAALACILAGVKGKKLGLFAPWLYSLNGAGTTDIVSGSNGAFQAGVGYDPVTGEGTPLAQKMLAAMK